MNTRIMAVALLVVSLLGVRAVQAEEVELVRIVPDGSLLNDAWLGSGNTTSELTVIVLGRPNDETTTFPPHAGCSGGGSCGALVGETWKNIEVVILWQPLHTPPVQITMQH